ncbi:helix-turn-helix transcriptional regulator [Hyphomonas sp.]|uniref:ArsR/SmtB family transcription factor n=1 Tax=Hyphomonas sp. TaxID=87 RepID=UPI0025BB3ACA|nr:metalloregulator ArsR/SmtB family transcription factor [Hyphomonas sp.]
MPNHFSSDPAALDRAFQALGDATRRGVLAQLALGEAPVSKLAEPYDMALPTFLQHLKVLEAGGLVSSRKQGRVRLCRLEAARLAELRSWIRQHEQVWAARLDRLDDFLNTHDPEKDT